MCSMREQQDVCVGGENSILVKIAQKLMKIPEIKESELCSIHKPIRVWLTHLQINTVWVLGS